MQAKVIRNFFGVQDGQFHPRTVKVGEVIEGDLARSGIEQGAAVPLDKSAPETRSLTGAPRNKAAR